jgi:hypothetical protein
MLTVWCTRPPQTMRAKAKEARGRIADSGPARGPTHRLRTWDGDSVPCEAIDFR